MTGIIPKSKAKDTDICVVGGYYYIIRSDLGCFMKTRDLNKGLGISVFSLHPSCKNGDHYIGGEDDYFYIIKGDSYRRVTDLTTDSDAEVHNLLSIYQGGDHYFATDGKFYIIFQGKGTYQTTTDMTQDTVSVEINLHPNCRNGLYYWGISNDCFFLKPDSKWGVEYYKGTDLSKDEPTGVYSVHPDVLNFLPGGLAVTKGPAFGIWENIKTITNYNYTAVKWQKKINKKVGYNKEKMTKITHYWKIATSASIETGDLTKLITKWHFSFPGGSDVSTESESWNEVTEEEQELSFELKPNESVYLWQYKMGFGEEPVLFWRDVKITRDPKPPTEVPLRPEQP